MLKPESYMCRIAPWDFWYQFVKFRCNDPCYNCWWFIHPSVSLVKLKMQYFLHKNMRIIIVNIIINCSFLTFAKEEDLVTVDVCVYIYILYYMCVCCMFPAKACLFQYQPLQVQNSWENYWSNNTVWFFLAGVSERVGGPLPNHI